jgi:predicted ATPase/DNA-binding CsgD family transcriptional regulator
MELHGRLPVGIAAFVGREQECAKVAELVMHGRVITLTGSGGCGKTRLAMEVAGAVESRFGDGACWAELQGVTEPGTVPAVVAAAVGVRERAGQDLADTIAEELRPRHLLVVLDNCEHLVGACAALVGRLSSMCPRVHVLATSRVPLAVEGESTFGVGPLPVPGPGVTEADTVAAADAARLFERRARQVHPEFQMAEGNAAEVAEICRRLDGIPLAIELAAARLRVLTPRQIATGLSDRFRLLTSRMRGAPDRQQTLEASLDWSYDLLDDAQRVTLARLSVFAGSFEYDAAEAVVAGRDIDRDDVLNLVTGLVEGSMVEVIERNARVRYRLLESVRVYARQRLSERDDPDRLRDCHLAFHVELAGRARVGLNGGDPEEWMTRLAADLDDLRAATEWAAATGNVHALVGLTEPIVIFWYGRGLSAEVHRRLHDVADAADIPDDQRARVLTTAAALAGDSGDVARAYEYVSQAVDAARAAESSRALPIAVGLRAYIGTASGRSSGHQLDADVEEAIRLAEQCEDPATRAFTLVNAAIGMLIGRTLDGGCRLLQQVLELCEANELTFQLPGVHAALGLVFPRGLDRRRRHAGRAVELSRQLGRPGWEVTGLTGLGAVALLQGNLGVAAEHLSSASAVVRRQGLEKSQYDMHLQRQLALLAHARGDLTAARRSAERILEFGHAGGNRWCEALGEWHLGMIGLTEGRYDDALEHLEASRASSTDPRFPLPLGRSLLGLAELARQDDDLEAAWELAHAGLQVLHEYGDRVGVAQGLEAIADLALVTEQPDRSLRLLGSSERFHTEAGLARPPVVVDRFERARDAARAALEDTEAIACWNAGAELSLQDAAAYAMRGRGERQRARFGWSSLTPAELDVVRLVADGHTNAQIGECLFMSVNTVKSHLTHVYAKLEVDGRADLAAQVARRNL